MLRICNTVRDVVRTISQQNLCTNTASVIEAVVNGESFVITRDDEPVAELRPVQTGRRALVPRDEIVAFAPAGVRISEQRFRADTDRWIDQGSSGLA